MKTQTLAPTALLPRLADATGGVVVCLATGPSLKQADVDYCRGKATVVAVNDSHLMAPWASVLYSGDRYWWGHYRGVREFGGLKASIEFTKGKHSPEVRKLVPSMAFYRLTGDDGVETDPSGLRTCRKNSGGQALNLALHLGARRILMLGYNAGMPKSKRNFFGQHPSPLSNATWNFVAWRLGFDSMAPDFKALGVEVINCTPNTSIGCFPTSTIQEAL